MPLDPPAPAPASPPPNPIPSPEMPEMNGEKGGDEAAAKVGVISDSEGVPVSAPRLAGGREAGGMVREPTARVAESCEGVVIVVCCILEGELRRGRRAET